MNIEGRTGEIEVIQRKNKTKTETGIETGNIINLCMNTNVYKDMVKIHAS